MKRGDPMPFGWCLDGHHGDCRARVYLSMQQQWKDCGCKCHEEEE